MKKLLECIAMGIRTLIIGFGKLASELLKTVCETKKGFNAPTLFPVIGRYKARDIEIIGVVDIREKAVREAESLIRMHNCGNVSKCFGLLLDDVPRKIKNNLLISTISKKKFLNFLTEINPDVAVISINSFAKKTAIEYANMLATLGISVINTTPVSLAWNEKVVRQFLTNKAAIVGDYIKGYVNPFSLYSIIINYLKDRGFTASETYFLERAGDLEGGSLLENADLIESKIKHILSKQGDDASITYAIDWRKFLKTLKMSHIMFKSVNNLDEIEVTISMKWNESKASSLILIDVIRALKAAVDADYFGRIDEICRYGFLFTDSHDFRGEITRFKSFINQFS